MDITAQQTIEYADYFLPATPPRNETESVSFLAVYPEGIMVLNYITGCAFTRIVRSEWNSHSSFTAQVARIVGA